MAVSQKDLEHLSSDMDKLHEEVGHIKKEHCLDFKERQHVNQLDRQLHYVIEQTRQIKSSNKFFRLSRSLHKWIGLALSVVILSLAITGIMLNHKITLGYMPDVKHEASGQLPQTLPMQHIVAIAIDAAGSKDIDRIDFRPNKMYAKVRFKDDKNTEIAVDAVTGKILNVGYRTDVFLEKLHTGEIFGDMFIIITDAAAVSLVLLTVTGVYLWIYPKRKRRLNEKKEICEAKKSKPSILLENA